MSTATGERKAVVLARYISTLAAAYPEWPAWLLSLVAWAYMVATLPGSIHAIYHTGVNVYCGAAGTVVAGALPLQQQLSRAISLSGFAGSLPGGLAHWAIMVVAMMFLLLGDPLRHVAYSVRRKDKVLGMLGFLAGYTITWTIAGVAFLALPLLFNKLIVFFDGYVLTLLRALPFLLSAYICYRPGRPQQLTRCSRTMPIRIWGWGLHRDTIRYGLRIGYICLGICWVPMVALMLAHHNIVLMYVVTVILIYERYLLPHISKLPAYAWAVLAVVVLGAEIWA